MDDLLKVEDLKVSFPLFKGTLKAVDGVSYSVGAGKSLGIIGESGSGKSITARAAMRIIPRPGVITDGKILLDPSQLKPEARVETWHGSDFSKPIDLAKMHPGGAALRKVRGGVISMIFQEPMTSLSPVHTIGDQITEAILLHRTTDKKEAKEIALEMLDRVRMSNPAQRFREYPHHLSGGMRQRAMIAMALSCNPSILIADEPTTALDVTVQSQILQLMKDLQSEFNMAIQYITHDLGVVAEVADTVAVMYLGRVVESGSVRQVLKNPQHPYTKGLIGSVPQMAHKSSHRLQTIRGSVPVPIDPPRRCGFVDRCDFAIKGKCDVHIPALTPLSSGHDVRCFLHSDKTEAENSSKPHDIAGAA
ncbi:ABC transporter ATP-binding protein [Devosia rhodophyticola]|uniref:ABC transporter ATP-binding protein n=1 Tax=Devosia rhodophyticola TaxID=3026423 RepID=A0ABY7YU05_9HYPH|nr:ABC transporter ATP-binding protein [Devosia rhodophyticola]WDR04796.1 ABC transporter ATP-binding protein [Devosia rhodophyticola]